MSKDNTEEKIFKIISEILNIDISKLNEETIIGEFNNWDSMNQLVIISEIEKQFKIQIDPETLMDFEDIGDMVEGVEVISKS
tara:strand:+ start:291 stop:536 length:246 start_codon:yes stop_codon:yes gene_type:complete